MSHIPCVVQWAGTQENHTTITLKLNFVLLATFVSSSYCGLIIHDVSDGLLHSKLCGGQGLHSEVNHQHSPIININNQQQVLQQPVNMISNHHQQQQHLEQHQQQHPVLNPPPIYGQLGDYGSLQNAHHVASSMVSNVKAGPVQYGAQHSLNAGYNTGSSLSYGSHQHLTGGSGNYHHTGSGGSHHLIAANGNNAIYGNNNHREGVKFGYHHDNSMFENAQGFSYSSSSSASSSASSAFGAASSASSSSSSSGGSSSSGSASSSGSGSGLKPWSHL